jgi:hypothetical protein
MAERIQVEAAKQAALIGGIEAGLPAGETVEGDGVDPFAGEVEEPEQADGDEQPEEPEVEA